MRMKKDNIGHNNPPLDLDDFIIKDENGKSTGRIKFTNTFLKKYLVRKYDAVKGVIILLSYEL